MWSKKLTSWQRKELESPAQNKMNEDQLKIRKLAEDETRKDLLKPIQQLLCDVHEEVHQPRTIEENIMHANKRMVSLLARAALSNDRASGILLFLTWVLVALTIVIAVGTIVIIILN